MGGLWRAALALAVAGCLQPVPVATLPADPALPAPETFTDMHDGCTGYLLALLVDPVLTDRFLPPGFHLRDPKDFFDRGVGTGLALLLVWATICAPTVQEPAWRDAAAAIYVQPPAVEGERPPADYDLYEIAHYSPEPSVQGRLAAWGWPVLNVSLEDQTTLREARDQAFSFAAGAQVPALPGLPSVAGDALFSFGGPTPLPSTLANLRQGVVRSWRDTPAGIGHLDQSLALPLNEGSGYCQFREGSLLAQAAGQTFCNAPPTKAGAPPQPVVAATFPTGIHIFGVLQRGVHAK